MNYDSSFISSLSVLPSPWRGAGGEALFQPCLNLFPVYNVPTCSDMINASVLEIKVISMFPHVKSIERCKALAQWIAAVCFLSDNEFAVRLLSKPSPTRTKQRCSCLSKLCLEVVEATESVVDSIENLTCWQVVLTWCTELIEIECVV